MKLARRTGGSFALAFVDLEGMKRINDTLGHESGDEALVSTAGILKSTFRASNIIARLGGDEFIVMAISAKAGSLARIRSVSSWLRQNITASARQYPWPSALALRITTL